MDELPRHAKTFLNTARGAHDPPSGTQERMWARIDAAARGSGAAAGTPDGRSARRFSLANGTKLALAGGVIALLGSSALLLRGETRQPTVATAPSKPARSLPPSAAGAPHAAAPVTDEARAELAPTERDAAKPSASTTVRAERRPRAAGPAAAQGGGDDNLLAELSLLSAASDALAAGDLQRAQDLLEQHRTRYPRGQLREERTGLDVLRRCLAGDSEALPRAHAYLRGAPHGMLSGRIKRACNIER
jgi:TolA-binding protein